MNILFSPINIRNLYIKNRIILSPISIYSAINGYPNEKHYNHYTTCAQEGCGGVIVEGTSVSPEGRISTADLGIWDNKHIESHSILLQLIEKSGCVPGIQLTHAGQKALGESLYMNYQEVRKRKNNWDEVVTAPLHYLPNNFNSQLLSLEDINNIISHFKTAAERAITAGYKIIEIHAAHGFLIHQFLSPLTNKRTDKYGGSLDNRIRLLMEITESIENMMTENHSLWVRIAATEWVEKGWSFNDSVYLANMLKHKGVDLIDVISGSTIPYAKKPTKKSYLSTLTNIIKKENNILTGITGSVNTPEEAEKILIKNQADVILLGMPLMRKPDFIKEAENKLI